MTDITLPRAELQQVLEAMENFGTDWDGWHRAYMALRERLAQPEQEFTTHEEGEDGWSDWVCPDPQSYLMKCCDCGLVHEAQFGVVRYKSETEREDCEFVDDPNVQAVFRMRRIEQWSPKDTAYRPGGLAQPEQKPVTTILLQSKQNYERNFGPSAAADWIYSDLLDLLDTAPPQRKPLPPQSPCEMTQAERKMFRLGWLECEAAHGIKGGA